MVVGYDAYHEKGSRSVSYGAVVSSLNQGLSRYLSQAAVHKNNEELADNFTLGIKSESSGVQAVFGSAAVSVHISVGVMILYGLRNVWC